MSIMDDFDKDLAKRAHDLMPAIKKGASLTDVVHAAQVLALRDLPWWKRAYVEVRLFFRAIR